MLPGKPKSVTTLIFRGGIAIAIVATIAVTMVLRATGKLDSNPTVTVNMPSSVGLVAGAAPVTYHGVHVGTVGKISAGPSTSTVNLAINRDQLPLIPANVLVRVAPRTFFGDVGITLVDNPAGRRGSARESSTLTLDTGPGSRNLYAIYTQFTEILDAINPAKLSSALRSLSTALDGRGDQIGRMIDDWLAAARALEPGVNALLDSTGKFERVMKSVQQAAPDVLASMRSMVAISQAVVGSGRPLRELITNATELISDVNPFLTAQRRNLITIINSTGTIMAATAPRADGIVRTIDAAAKFSVGGAQVFSTGKFNITAVPSFSQPMPYSGANCPTYQGLDGKTIKGRNCFGAPTPGTGPTKQSTERASSFADRPDVISGPAEAAALGSLQDTQIGQNAPLNIATVMMVGPMVRGAEVTPTAGGAR